MKLVVDDDFTPDIDILKLYQFALNNDMECENGDIGVENDCVYIRFYTDYYRTYFAHVSSSQLKTVEEVIMNIKERLREIKKLV